MLKKIYSLLRKQISGYKGLRQFDSDFSYASKIKCLVADNSPFIKQLAGLNDTMIFSISRVLNSFVFTLESANHSLRSKIIPPTNAEYILFEKGQFNKTFIIETNLKGILLSKSILFKPKKFLVFLANRSFYFRKVVKIGARTFILFENKNHKNISVAREYIPIDMGRLKFLETVKQMKVNSVVLRWFDAIEDYNCPEEDLDILVSDNDIEKIKTLCNSTIGYLPLDVYTASGLNGSDWAGLPYYPTEFANSILKNKCEHINGYYVPDNYHHLISLSYHALYHKGQDSGLPMGMKGFSKKEDVDHDYFKTIDALLESNQLLDYRPTLESLSSLLNNIQVAPTLDLLFKLQEHRNNNQWIRREISLYKERINEQFETNAGICVFILRKEAFNPKNLEFFHSLLYKFGFHVLNERELIDSEAYAVSKKIRGGNWGKGPFDKSGGLPSYCIAAYDPFLLNPSSQSLEKYPNIENDKIIQIKKISRELFSPKNNFNGLHSSDNFYESVDYISSLWDNGDVLKTTLDKATIIRQNHNIKYKVLQELSAYSKRAKIELIEYMGAKAVIKRFNILNGLDHLRRELSFYDRFEGQDFIPKLLFAENNYLILEYLEGFKSISGMIVVPLPLIKKLKIIFEYLLKSDVVVIDLNPKNVFTDGKNIKIIDFEFAQNYENPEKLVDSYDLNKMPESFEGELPHKYNEITNFYNSFWKEILDMSLLEFVNLK